MDGIINLPQELKDIIWSFVDITVKVWVTKEYYEKYHNKIILKKIPDFYNYMNYVIIKKHNYVFSIIYPYQRSMWQKKLYKNNYLGQTFESHLKKKAEQYNNNYVIEIIKESTKTKVKEKNKYLTWRK